MVTPVAVARELFRLAWARHEERRLERLLRFAATTRAHGLTDRRFTDALRREIEIAAATWIAVVTEGVEHEH